MKLREGIAFRFKIEQKGVATHVASLVNTKCSLEIAFNPRTIRSTLVKYDVVVSAHGVGLLASCTRVQACSYNAVA